MAISEKTDFRPAEFSREDVTIVNIRICIVLLLLPLCTAFAADLTGKWSGTFRATGADHDIPQLFILQQDGAGLHGSGGPDQSEQYPIENAVINGDKVTFELTTGEWRFSYRLRVSGGEMSGDLDLKSENNARKAKVSLKRVE